VATTTQKRGSAHIARQARRSDGRVVATYSKSQLYELVRKAAFKAKPHHPEKLSVREFDRTVGSLGYPDAPSARAICARLKRGWPEIVELAIDNSASRQKIDAPTNRSEAEWLTVRHLVFGLKRIALFKGVETMSAHDYDLYLAEFVASRPEPAHVLGVAARFPTSGQILRIAATLDVKADTPWDKALVYAGLKPVSKTTQKTALTIVEAIDLYIEASLCEFYPSRDELERVRTELGVSVQKPEKGVPWSKSLEEALDRRKAAGLPVPTMKAATTTKPKLVLPPGFEAPRTRTSKGTWEEKTDDELVEAIVIYIQDCLGQSPAVKPTKKHFKSWRKGRTDIPSTGTLDDRTTWTEWMKLANDRLMELKKRRKP
jgi:hypothetical protein